MDIVKQEDQAARLRKARAARGFATAKDAAIRFGFNYNTYSQHERGHAGIVRAARHYARAFGVSEAWLLTGETGTRPTLTVPFMGTAAGALAGSWQAGSTPLDWIPAPPGLLDIHGVYAFIVKGNSMAPEHREGELRFASELKRPVSGDSVTVQVRNVDDSNSSAFIKRLVRITDSEVIVTQHEPPATIRYRRETVIAVHKVLTVNELFGI